MLSLIKQLIPTPIRERLLPLYHFSFALLGALRYRFPSRHLVVIGVTGTKGKTSTTEILNNILESAGIKTAVLGTLRFKVGQHNQRNLKKNDHARKILCAEISIRRSEGKLYSRDH